MPAPRRALFRRAPGHVRPACRWAGGPWPLPGAQATRIHGIGPGAVRQHRRWLRGEHGAEALPLLLTLSSGVKGFTTIHAGSARQALTRLRFICQLADTSNELPLSALSALVSEAVDLVVHCARVDGEVRVTEIVAVEELQTGRESTQFTMTEVFTRTRFTAPLTWTGNVPARAARALEGAGYDVRALLGEASRATNGRRPASRKRAPAGAAVEP